MAGEGPSRRGGQAGAGGPGAKPVDLAHLAGQTGGDRALESEVLLLFQERSAADFDRLKNAVAGPGRRAAAHMIVGSARAIGAHEVARLAALIENDIGSHPARMAELAAAIEAARRFVSAYLSR